MYLSDHLQIVLRLDALVEYSVSSLKRDKPNCGLSFYQCFDSQLKIAVLLDITYEEPLTCLGEQINSSSCTILTLYINS